MLLIVLVVLYACLLHECLLCVVLFTIDLQLIALLFIIFSGELIELLIGSLLCNGIDLLLEVLT